MSVSVDFAAASVCMPSWQDGHNGGVKFFPEIGYKGLQI
jgi:hypothetical protein